MRHAYGVLQIGDRWLWCSICGALRPQRPMMPWFQPSDHHLVQEYVLRAWGLDPHLLSGKRRRRQLEKRIAGARVAPVPGVAPTSLEGLNRLLSKLRTRYGLPKLSDRRRSWGYRKKKEEQRDAPADEPVSLLPETDRVE